MYQPAVTTPREYKHDRSFTAGLKYVQEVHGYHDSRTGNTINSGNTASTATTVTSYGNPRTARSTFAEPPPSAPLYQQNFGSGHPVHSQKAASHVFPPDPSRPAGQEPEPVPGKDYFMIGDLVQVRRYRSKDNTYTRWLTGKVIMPFFTPRGIERDGEPRKRAYEVEYYCPVDSVKKTRAFHPHLGEIADAQTDISKPVPKNPTPGKAVVYALLQHPYRGRDGQRSVKCIWTPCYLLTSPNTAGVSVRALAGHATNIEFHNITQTQAYRPDVAQGLKNKGYEVIGDGTQRFT